MKNNTKRKTALTAAALTLPLVLAGCQENRQGAANTTLKTGEYETAQKAVCAFNRLGVRTDDELKACGAFVVQRGVTQSEGENKAVFEAVCKQRHGLSGTYNTCITQFGQAYATHAVLIIDPVGEEDGKDSVATACVKGATTSLLTHFVFLAGAVTLDALGCGGLCTATALKVTTLSLPAQTAYSCVNSAVAHELDNAADGKNNRRNPLQRTPALKP